MASDLTARPSSAPAMHRVRAYARYELGLLARNPEQLLLTLVIPIALLIGLANFGSRLGVDRSSVLGSVIAIAVIATSFTSLAIATSFERRSASLQLLATTPLTSGNLLTGKALAVTTFELVQLVILTLVGSALGLGPIALAPTVVVVLLGSASFAALGFFVAGVLRAEAVLAVANGVFLFFLIACGLTVPSSAFPAAWAAIIQFTPATALAASLEAAAHGAWDLAAMTVFLLWGATAAVLARFTFRWDS